MKTREAIYRLRLAEGFLEEARQDVVLQRWRSALDNSQLAVEHAARSVLALLGPVGRTHNPGMYLRQALEQQRFDPSWHSDIQSLIEKAELLGPDIHIQTDYGDEVGGLTPWELFNASDAHQALRLAEEALIIASRIVYDTQKSGEK